MIITSSSPGNPCFVVNEFNVKEHNRGGERTKSRTGSKDEGRWCYSLFYTYVFGNRVPRIRPYS